MIFFINLFLESDLKTTIFNDLYKKYQIFIFFLLPKTSNIHFFSEFDSLNRDRNKYIITHKPQKGNANPNIVQSTNIIQNKL